MVPYMHIHLSSLPTARVAAGTWWLGTLILIQSYTANLAAFLTIKISSEEINSVEDLAQSTHRYGSVEDSQIQTYFDTSTRYPYRYAHCSHY